MAFHFKYTLLFVFLCFISTSVKAELYYVTPNSSTPCPETGVHCANLSTYATKPNDYFSSNSTLVMLPGKHKLNANFLVANLSHFQIMKDLNFSPSSNASVSVSCGNIGQFTFDGISNVSISNLQLMRCKNISITSALKFTLENCTLSNETRLELKWVQSVTISYCNFSMSTNLIKF